MSENDKRSVFNLVISEFALLSRSLDNTMLKFLLKWMLKWSMLVSVFLVILPSVTRYLYPENSDLYIQILITNGIAIFFSIYPLIIVELCTILDKIRLNDAASFVSLSSLIAQFLIISFITVGIFLVSFVLLLVLEIIRYSNRTPIVVNFVTNVNFLWFLGGLVVFSFIEARYHASQREIHVNSIRFQEYLLNFLFFVPLVLYISFGASLVKLWPFELEKFTVSIAWQIFFLMVLLVFFLTSFYGYYFRTRSSSRPNGLEFSGEEPVRGLQ